jgi:hypothetical protein
MICSLIESVSGQSMDAWHLVIEIEKSCICVWPANVCNRLDLIHHQIDCISVASCLGSSFYSGFDLFALDLHPDLVYPTPSVVSSSSRRKFVTSHNILLLQEHPQ